LLEFQSTVDWHMAVRMMTDVGLLYEELIKQKQLSPGGRLPPVFPVVLYNGTRLWQAPTDIESLIARGPAGLEAFRPHLRYHLINEQTVKASELTTERNLAAAIFRLEQSRSRPEAAAVIRTVINWLEGPEQEIPVTQRLEDLEVMLAE
jgi:hypothetical protein